MIAIFEAGVYLRADGINGSGTFCNGIHDRKTDAHIPSEDIAIMFNNMLHAVYNFLTIECDLSEAAANREIKRILRVDEKDKDKIIMKEYW